MAVSGRRAVSWACAIALAVCQAAAADPRYACADPVELSAMQTTAMQQGLMDAGLACGAAALRDFNAFQTSFGFTLRNADASVLSMFQRIWGADWGRKAFDRFKTDLANSAELSQLN